ncbi:MAG TPA: DinB family protein [Terriglobales bacterium]|nr:DinB family protein [Terriglobales bacterium]
MTDLNTLIATSLAQRYEELGELVKQMSEPLSEEQFWQKPFSFGNSFGHLVLHLTGNLNYYIGAEIAKTGYVRDRPREFAEAARPPKQEVMKRFDEAVGMVGRTIRAQKQDDWGKAYSAKGEDDAENRFTLLLRCATHLHHHVGQMMYLTKKLETGRADNLVAD